MEKYHVGVDVGKDSHHVCIRDISTDTYHKTFSVKNNRDGFMELISSLEKLSAEKDDFLIGIEACFYGLNLTSPVVASTAAFVEAKVYTTFLYIFNRWGRCSCSFCNNIV